MLIPILGKVESVSARGSRTSILPVFIGRPLSDPSATINRLANTHAQPDRPFFCTGAGARVRFNWSGINRPQTCGPACERCRMISASLISVKSTTVLQQLWQWRPFSVGCIPVQSSPQGVGIFNCKDCFI